MKTSKIIAAAALTILAAAGAQAETYEGVHAPVSANSRADVNAQAVATAHEANQNLDRKAFVNSVIPSQYKITRPVTQQAGL